jgi:pimeloyl-ACP methyl ester carboxylesterase
MIQALRGGMESVVTQVEAGRTDYWQSERTRARWLAADAEASIASWLTWSAHPGFADVLPSMNVPALLYCKTEDNPEPVRQAVREMPDASFVALEGLDHGDAYTRSDLVLPHVKPFLERVARETASVAP